MQLLNKGTLRLAAPLLAVLGLAGLAQAQIDDLDLFTIPANPGPGDDIVLVVENGTEGDYVGIAVSTDPGPTNFPIVGLLNVGLVNFDLLPAGQFDANGRTSFPCALDCLAGTADPYYTQAFSLRLGPPIELAGKSNPLAVVIDDFNIQDCNGNGNDDDCDIEEGISLDCNDNFVPDECETDCNGNGVPDDCDIRDGTSTDANGNGLPDECETSCCENGDPVLLTLCYTGEDCSATVTTQDPGKFSCVGDPAFAATVHVLATDKEDPADTGANVWFEGDVALGAKFDISAALAGENKLKSETWVHIFDSMGNILQTINFHTSCSQPLFVGDQYGSMLVTDCVGDDEPIPGDCCENGDPVVLTMLYTGEDCSATVTTQDPGKYSCSGDPAFAGTVQILASDSDDPTDGGANIWFQGDVDLNAEFDIDAALAGENKLKNETWVYVFDLQGNLLQTVTFHTSCSQPVFVGDQYGSVRITDCVGENEPPVGQGPDACADGKPQVLTMRYTGEDCSASSNSQDPGKATCSGDPAFAPTVHILSTDKEDPADGGAKIWFQGDVDLNTTFDIDATNAGETKFPSETWVHIFDLQGGVLQTVEFHTSCSQPLFVGNQFGAVLLEDFVPEP